MAWWWGSDGPNLLELMITVLLLGPLVVGAAIFLLSGVLGGATAAGKTVRDTSRPTPRPPAQPGTFTARAPNLPSSDLARAPEPAFPAAGWSLNSLDELVRHTFVVALELLQIGDQVTTARLTQWVDLTMKYEHSSYDARQLVGNDAALIAAHNAIARTHDSLRLIEATDGDPPEDPDEYARVGALCCALLEDQANPAAKTYMEREHELQELAQQYRRIGLA